MQRRLCETANFWAVQLGQSDKAVRRALSGVEPDGMRGREQPTYTLAKIFEALVPKGDAGEYDDQRQRLAAAQAEKVERENAVRAGELVEASKVVAGVGEHINAARTRLLRLPGAIAAQMPPDQRASLEATARRLVYEALNELAEWEL